ncbi:MAG: hypothetical protein JOZ91_03710 [Candidatus Eremiobacteraeota bacterium]|nr:hypothetical protein [Candidatus Eremiobacteraeota bacterium]
MKLKLVAVALALGAALTAGSVAFADDSMSNSSTAMQGRFGGPVYNGPPALAVTASLVAAGGGADKYSTATALTSMLGQDTVNAEVAKLTKQYGADAVKMWLKTFDFAVDDALKIATAAGVKLPSPTLSGKELATTLVKAGTAADGTFQIEYLLDKAVTHKIHVQVMDDIDNDPSLGKKADYDYHRISNQAFYDVAQALGMTSVKLAAVH